MICYPKFTVTKSVTEECDKARRSIVHVNKTKSGKIDFIDQQGIIF